MCHFVCVSVYHFDLFGWCLDNHKMMNILTSQYKLICRDRDMTVAAWSCCKTKISGAMQTMQSLLSLSQLTCASLACPSNQNNEVWWCEVPWYLDIYFTGFVFCMKGHWRDVRKQRSQPLLIRFTWSNWKKATDSSCLMTSRPRVVRARRWWDDGHTRVTDGWCHGGGRNVKLTPTEEGGNNLSGAARGRHLWEGC